jgi:formamidopyrimidine-DNA glycosylase
MSRLTAQVPEILEAEMYRRTAERVVGRRIANVETLDEWYLKGADPAETRARFAGASVVAARRTGKLLMLDTEAGVLGLRFGMTGRLAVDGRGPEFDLEYAPVRDDPRWDRFALSFDGGGRLRLQDPRRLGAVVIDPDESTLGPDALLVTLREVRAALVGEAAVKAALLDQARIAGIGNLLADEVLWHAGIDPARRCDSLVDDEVRSIHRAIRRRLPVLFRRGGSHLGDIPAADRVRGVRCPRCGTELARRTIGGRTTYSCPLEQR